MSDSRVRVTSRRIHYRPPVSSCFLTRKIRNVILIPGVHQFCMATPSSHRKPIPPPCQTPSPNGLVSRILK